MLADQVERLCLSTAVEKSKTSVAPHKSSFPAYWQLLYIAFSSGQTHRTHSASSCEDKALKLGQHLRKHMDSGNRKDCLPLYCPAHQSRAPCEKNKSIHETENPSRTASCFIQQPTNCLRGRMNRATLLMLPPSTRFQRFTASECGGPFMHHC